MRTPKAFVITIVDLPESVAAAERCIKSAKEVSNLDVEISPAVTPKHNPRLLAKKLNISTTWFKADKGSRPENVISAFLSHWRLWDRCSKGKEDFIIFEHDAVVVNEIPTFMNHSGCISLGAPSYGKFEQPFQLGVIPLVSKRYFPGAHAYRVSPKGAKIISTKALDMAGATDVFLNLDLFPFLEEYYPWPVVAKDTFSTIQNETGCLAKHGYNRDKENYEIISVK
jgi:GR25 family glycosyltransferase involved in LPS biosynthesis